MNVFASYGCSTPKRLASRRPQARSSPTARVPGLGVTSSSSLNASSAVGGDEPRADDDVLVGERHQRPVVRLVHQAPQHRSRLE